MTFYPWKLITRLELFSWLNEPRCAFTNNVCSLSILCRVLRPNAIERERRGRGERENLSFENSWIRLIITYENETATRIRDIVVVLMTLTDLRNTFNLISRPAHLFAGSEPFLLFFYKFHGICPILSTVVQRVWLDNNLKIKKQTAQTLCLKFSFLIIQKEWEKLKCQYTNRKYSW